MAKDRYLWGVWFDGRLQQDGTGKLNLFRTKREANLFLKRWIGEMDPGAKQFFKSAHVESITAQFKEDG